MITKNPYYTSLYKGRIYITTDNGSKYLYNQGINWLNPIDAGAINGFQEIQNTGTLGIFTGTTVPALANATYDLNITINGGALRQTATALLNTDTWAGICTKITAVIHALEAGTVVSIVDGKIRVTSPTTGATSTVLIAAGTAGSGGGDLLAAITALAATYTATIGTAVIGLAATIDVDTKLKAAGYPFPRSHKERYYMNAGLRQLMTIGTADTTLTAVDTADTFTIFLSWAGVPTTVTITTTVAKEAAWIATNTYQSFVEFLNETLAETAIIGASGTLYDYCQFFLYDKKRVGFKVREEQIATGRTVVLTNVIGTTLTDGLHLSPVSLTVIASKLYTDYVTLRTAILAGTDITDLFVENTAAFVTPSFSTITIANEHIASIDVDATRLPETFNVRY